MRKWTRQPPAGTKIDWSNPLTNGLVAAWVFNNYPRVQDAAGSHHILTSPSNVTQAYRAIGGTHVFDGTVGSGHVVAHAADLDATGDFSLAAGIINGSSDGNDEIIEKQSGNPMYQLYNEGTTQNLIWYGRDAAGTLITCTGSALPIDQHQNVVGTKGSATGSDWVRLYQDGVETANAEDTSTGDWSNASDLILGSGQNQWDGELSYVYIWQRELTAAEVALLNENPWQIFKGPRNFALADPLPDTRVLSVPKIISWTKQPPPETPIDWSNPLTKGLVFASVGSQPDINLVDGAHPSDGTTFAVRPGADGLGLGLDPNDLTFAPTDGSFWNKWHDSGRTFGFATYSLLLRETDTGANDTILEIKINNNRHTLRFVNAAQNETLSVSYYDTAEAQINAGPVATPIVIDGKAHGAACSCESDGTLTLYGDGISIGTPGTTSNPGFLAQTLNNGFGVGNDWAGGTNWPGLIYLSLLWTRPLSAVEHAQLHVNPWQIFKPRKVMVPTNEDLPDLGTFEKPWDDMPL